MTSLLGPQRESQSKQHTGALQWTPYTTKLGKHGLRGNWAAGGLRGLQAPCQIFSFSLRIPDGKESGGAGSVGEATDPTSDVLLWAAEGKGGWGSCPVVQRLI